MLQWRCWPRTSRWLLWKSTQRVWYLDNTTFRWARHYFSAVDYNRIPTKIEEMSAFSVIWSDEWVQVTKVEDHPCDEWLTLETSASNLSTVAQFTLSTQLINTKFCVSLPHRCSTTVSLETNPLAPTPYAVYSRACSHHRSSKWQLKGLQWTHTGWHLRVVLHRDLDIVFGV